jgi:D-alanine-D-alanine ligase
LRTFFTTNQPRVRHADETAKGQSRTFFDRAHGSEYRWNMDGTKRIGVLLGGHSAERDLSVRAGEAVLTVLRDAGHDAIPLFVDREIDLALRQARVEVAFLALRGRYGGDGCLQGLLELLGIPYTGSSVLASGLAMNRSKTKEVLRLHNLPTSPGYVVRYDAPDALEEAHRAFGFPVVIRPVGIAAPMGPAVARDELELESALEDAFRLDDEVLVERVIDGRRVCVGLLDGEALGAVELPAAGPRARLTASSSAAKISGARYKSILRLATSAYEAMGCEGAACVELVVSDRVNEVVVDIDTNPLLTPTAPLARIAQMGGVSYTELVYDILGGARLRAHGHRQNRRAVQVSFDGPDRRGTTAATAAH